MQTCIRRAGACRDSGWGWQRCKCRNVPCPLSPWHDYHFPYVNLRRRRRGNATVPTFFRRLFLLPLPASFQIVGRSFCAVRRLTLALAQLLCQCASISAVGEACWTESKRMIATPNFLLSTYTRKQGYYGWPASSSLLKSLCPQSAAEDKEISEDFSDRGMLLEAFG